MRINLKNKKFESASEALDFINEKRFMYALKNFLADGWNFSDAQEKAAKVICGSYDRAEATLSGLGFNYNEFTGKLTRIY